MGSSQSQISQPDQLPISPVILKLRQACKLTTNTKYTQSFINYNFSLLLQKNNGIISRSMNPFCPVQVDQSQTNNHNYDKNNSNNIENNKKQHQWIDCCLISPIMAIANPKYLINDTKQRRYNKARINGIGQKQKIILSAITKIFVLQQSNSLALLVFDKPIVNLGWIGLTYFSSVQQLTKSQSQSGLKLISHTSRQLRKTNKGAIYNYHQEILKINYKFFNQEENNMIIKGEGKGKQGGLIVKIVNKKPYLVGVQIQSNQCVFINKEIHQQIKFIAQSYVNQEKQREILESIDIHDFQIMSKI